MTTATAEKLENQPAIANVLPELRKFFRTIKNRLNDKNVVINICYNHEEPEDGELFRIVIRKKGQQKWIHMPIAEDDLKSKTAMNEIIELANDIDNYH